MRRLAFAILLCGCTNTVTTLGEGGAPRDMTERDAPAPRDFATPDFAAPDLAGADFATPPDFACAPCTNPPANTCSVDGTMTTISQVTYPNPGACNAGSCDYPPSTMACTFGCYNGACTAKLDTFNNQAGYQTGTSTLVNINGGTAPATNSVSVVVQTAPRGSAQTVTLTYTIDNFTTSTTMPMIADPNTPAGASYQQWYFIIPQQSMGTKVIFYMLATGWDGTQIYNSNFNANWSYTSQ